MNNKLKKTVKGNIAVFIDAANLELSAKDRSFHVDYKKLYKWLLQLGKLVYVGFFTVRFDTKKHDAFLTLLKKSGYKLTTKPVKLIKNNKVDAHHIRKANFDVEIAVESLKRKDLFDTIILFSGDSDFDYLLRELKNQRKKTVVISMKYHISRELIKSADIYVDLTKIRGMVERKNQ